jgi:hypothetical protein
MKTTKNNPWAAMDAIVNANPEPMGEEWFTADQYADRYGRTRDASFSRLAKWHKDGIVDRWSGLGETSRHTITKWRVRLASGHF